MYKLNGATMDAANFHSGEVFSLSTSGDNFAGLYSFTPAEGFLDNNNDGMYPNSLLLAGGVLYGTANDGGLDFAGTVFTLSSDAPFIFHVKVAPVLGINLSGGNVVLNWTTNSDNGPNDFLVQYAAGLDPSFTWSDLGQPPVLVNDQHVVTNTPTGPEIYYRLFRPDPGSGQ